MCRNPRRLTGVCRQTPSSFPAYMQMAEVSLMWDSPRAQSPGDLWMGSKLAVWVYPAQPSRHTMESSGLSTAVPPSTCPSLSDRNPCLTTLHQAELWEGRKEVVVVLRYNWCDPQEPSADGGCRFIVLPARGLQQAPISGYWDQGPASKLQQGLYDSAARQRDTFLTRELPICTRICHQVWSDSVLNSWRYPSIFTSFMKTKDPESCHSCYATVGLG